MGMKLIPQPLQGRGAFSLIWSCQPGSSQEAGWGRRKFWGVESLLVLDCSCGRPDAVMGLFVSHFLAGM